MGLLAVPVKGWAQGGVPVTVFDGDLAPYTAWGTPDETGSIIIFEPAPPGGRVRGGAEARPSEPAEPAGPTYPAAPAPSYPVIEMPRIERTVPAPPPAVQLRTVQPAPAGAPEAETGGAAPAAGEYVDGVYVANTDYLLSYPENVLRVLTSPLRFERSDWINAALVAGITGGLLLLDEEFQDFWQGDVRGDTSEAFADGFRGFGESRNVIFASLGGYALAELLDSTAAVDAKREKSAALLALQSFLITQGFVTSLKYVTGRERPEETDDAFDFNGPALGDFNASFPSGHAGSAFAVASVLSETYGEDNPWVPWLAYATAAGTALSRVDDDRHWLSDVFLGGAIGYFTGKMVTRYSPFLARNNITLRPFTEDGAMGVAVSLRH